METFSAFAPVSKNAQSTLRNSTNSETDPNEEQAKVVKGNLGWLEEKCSGNQNILHVCASNISARKYQGRQLSS